MEPKLLAKQLKDALGDVSTAHGTPPLQGKVRHLWMAARLPARFR
jgi:hypothetical protein